MSVEIVSWADGTDEQIAAMLDAAAAGEIDLQQDAGWRVGDKRFVSYESTSSVPLTTWHVGLAITSFNEYMGCGNVLQFDFTDICSKAHITDDLDVTDYTYKLSPAFRMKIRDAIEILPPLLRNRLQTFDILIASTAGSIETISNNKLALRSEREVFGTGPAEGEQLSYYNNSTNRIKYWFEEGKSHYSTDAQKWLLRTIPETERNAAVSETGTFINTNEKPGIAPFGCLGGYTGPEIKKSVKVDENNFPDSIFRNIIAQFDNDGDGYLNHYEIENCTRLSAYLHKNFNYIESLIGIEHLACLEFLSLSSRDYTFKDEELDLTNLERFNYLDIRYAPRIQRIRLKGQPLYSVHIEYCRQFEHLEFEGDPLELQFLSVICIKEGIVHDLDVSKCTGLKFLYLVGNAYRGIDIRNNPRLLLAHSSPQNAPRITWEYGTIHYSADQTTATECAVKTEVSYNAGSNPLQNLYPEDNLNMSTYTLVYRQDTNIITGDIELTTPPEDVSCWEKEAVTFYCEGDSEEPLSYIWERKGIFGWSELGNGQSLAFIPTPNHEYYEYRCKIYQPSSNRVYYLEDQGGKNPRNEILPHHYFYTDKVHLLINYPIIIKEQPVNSVNIINGLSTFTVVASNDPPVIYDDDDDVAYRPDHIKRTINYQWQQLIADGEEYQDVSDARSASLNVVVSAENKDYKYRCKVSDGTHELISNEVRVIVVDNLEGRPAVLNDPEDLTIMEGTSGTFSVEAFGDDLSYQWQSSNNNGVTWSDIRYATNADFDVLASLTMAGLKYRCRVYNSIGEAYSASALLDVYPDDRLLLPSIVTQPYSVSVNEGNTATFMLEASGDDLHYQWQTNQNGTWYNIDGATSSSYSTVAAMSLNRSKYRCQVSNAAGSLYSNEATLSVTSEQSIRTPTITSQPRSITVEEGQQAAFRVSASGGSLSYQWQVKKSGTWYEISGAESSTLYVRGAADTNNNQYRCLVANSAGSVYSTIATLSVRETGPLTFYGYHSIFISGKNTYGEWEMYPTSRPHVAQPEVKTSYVDVPGADGGLDYTELLNGTPNYGYRKGSWEFLLIPQEKWPDVYRSLCNYLHGREHTIILEDDPNWEYTGRLAVNEWRSAAHNSLITIDYILDPTPVNREGEEYDPDEYDLDAAERLLRKPGNEDKAIILWQGAATIVDKDSFFEDGDDIAY